MSAPIIASMNDFDKLEAALSSARRVAIDTEFHAERRFLPELYLVQVHIDPGEGAGKTWIIDPLRDDLLVRIGPALRAVPWVVHAGEQDIRVLDQALGGLPDVVLDTQVAAGLISDHYPAPYAGLVDRYLGRSLDKGETLSDWSRRPLTNAQLTYAALDVSLLLDLWDAIDEIVGTRGRREVALAACADARVRAAEGMASEEAFREIGATAALSGAALRVLQELAAWRLERARETNQPVRAVLSDGVLIDLARRQPSTPQSLLANRRLPKSIAREATDLVERIRRAVARPEVATPRAAAKRTAAWRGLAWLQVWAEAVGTRESFASGLVFPRVLLEALWTDPPEDRGALASRLAWRDALAGDLVWDALAGRVHLGLHDGDVALTGGDPRSGTTFGTEENS